MEQDQIMWIAQWRKLLFFPYGIASVIELYSHAAKLSSHYT